MTIGTRSFAERPSYRHLVDKRWVIIPGACLVDAPRHRLRAKAIVTRARGSKSARSRNVGLKVDGTSKPTVLSRSEPRADQKKKSRS
jgi:hypothetical protein